MTKMSCLPTKAEAFLDIGIDRLIKVREHHANADFFHRTGVGIVFFVAIAAVAAGPNPNCERRDGLLLCGISRREPEQSLFGRSKPSL